MSTSLNKLVVLMMMAGALLLSGCNSTSIRPDPAYAPPRPSAMVTSKPNDGAIFNSQTNISLFEDTKAHRVGDIVTILLTESTNASKSASTSLDKSTSLSMDNPTILGSTPQFNVPGIVPLASNQGNTAALSLGSDHEFEGNGDSSQSNSLNGSITVSVMEVLPNGNLVVRGEKWLTLNQGEEFIRISGIVRPSDIGSNNTISSTKVANARISYSGTGAVAESNAMGWIAKFFIKAIWPF